MPLNDTVEAQQSMIWYLLYPLRGTTEPPALAPIHPVRRLAANYGRYAACHVVTTLLVSTAIATMLIYPIPFLFTRDFTTGASNLPHHVWTVAQPLPYDTTAEPDVIMRSVWVHASYMRALDKTLLTSALELQDHLLGKTQNFNPQLDLDDSARRFLQADAMGADAFPLKTIQRDAIHVSNGLTNSSWFFHSPLLYWRCSQDLILSDTDIISTINDRKNQSTSVNVTLRHSIVFSGKRFEDRRLLAADALVITLLHLRDSPIGRQWEQVAAALTPRVANKWDIYPGDGKSSSSRLYEFQFRPLSIQDIIILILGYTSALLYFTTSVSRNKVVKSKFGLIVTVLVQLAFSVTSSFTICGILNIDLSRVPQTWYPIVIFAMSQENIFRLINAVICTRSAELASSRIGHAFGETAHTAAIGTLQNTLMAFGLSRVVSSAVSPFCTWLAVAAVFDFFYLSTFFLAVLSVDIRRSELSDALSKASSRKNRRRSDSRTRSTWFEQVLQGKAALSTRIAGTIIMVCSVLMAQWHFFDEDIFKAFFRWCSGSRKAVAEESSRAALLRNIHQARSPASWLRLQDHETAREVINIIKPAAYSYVARVYEPIVFVAKGSNRMPTGKESMILPAAHDFVHHELARFVVIIVIVVAALRILTNYLLWEDDRSLAVEHDVKEEKLLSVVSFPGGHKLDIVMMITSLKGHVVTVGLDRSIRIWEVRPEGFSYAIPEGSCPERDPFPVLALAIDREAHFLALVSARYTYVWSLSERAWRYVCPIDLGATRVASVFFYTGVQDAGIRNPPILGIMLRDGRLVRIDISSRASGAYYEITKGPVLCNYSIVVEKHDLHCSNRLFILTTSLNLTDCVLHQEGSAGRSRKVLNLGPSFKAQQIVALPGSSFFLVASVNEVHLISSDDVRSVQVFRTHCMRRGTLRCVFTPHWNSNAASLGIVAMVLAYDDVETGDCVVHVWRPFDDRDAIWAKSPSQADQEWCTWEEAKEEKRTIASPGAWDLLPDGHIVGIRRNASIGRCEPKSVYQLPLSASMRHRLGGLPQTCSADPLDNWEGWSVSLNGALGVDEVCPLLSDKNRHDHLLISCLGPRARIGQRSVAFAFGNVLKIMSVGGHEKFGAEANDASSWSKFQVAESRRRRQGSSARPRAWS